MKNFPILDGSNHTKYFCYGASCYHNSPLWSESLLRVAQCRKIKIACPNISKDILAPPHDQRSEIFIF